jgi:hypothetical protein
MKTFAIWFLITYMLVQIYAIKKVIRDWLPKLRIMKDRLEQLELEVIYKRQS